MATAIFAAGCFWGVQAAFQQVQGVTETYAGYTGGETEEPTYEEVYTDRTGHAEAVQIEYNPDEISYQQLLDIFFSIHNPTELNRQGPDIGSQYRSVIFYCTEEQRLVAEDNLEKREKSGMYNTRIVTKIVPASGFWPAEEYHQSFYLKVGRRYGEL